MDVGNAGLNVADASTMLSAPVLVACELADENCGFVRGHRRRADARAADRAVDRHGALRNRHGRRQHFHIGRSAARQIDGDATRRRGGSGCSPGCDVVDPNGTFRVAGTLSMFCVTVTVSVPSV